MKIEDESFFFSNAALLRLPEDEELDLFGEPLVVLGFLGPRFEGGLLPGCGGR